MPQSLSVVVFVAAVVAGCSSGGASTSTGAGGTTSSTASAGGALASGATATSTTSASSTTTGTTSTGSGAQGCAPPPPSSMVVDVTASPYSATPNDTTDDTSAIQKAIDAVAGTGGTVLIPDGTFMIDATKSLILHSNMTLKLSQGAVLKAIATSNANYDVIRIAQASNVNVVGGTIAGERATHTGTGGEWGMGLSIHASQHVVIDGVTSRDCWGDGFYVTEASSDVTLCNLTSDHNRRQGMSITSVDKMRVTGCTFENTTGTLPEAGVDIEPNVGETANDVQFLDCIFKGNAGEGIEIGVPVAYSGQAFITNVKLDHSEAASNGKNTLSTSPRSGITVSDTTGHTITGCNTHDNVGDGVLLRDGADNMIFTSNTVTNNGANGMEEYKDSGNSFTNNTVTGNGQHGFLTNSCTGTTQAGNTFAGDGIAP
jgi:parallel beta-helix repeat protein